MQLQLQTLSQTQKMNPIQPASELADNQPAQDIESKLKPVGSLEKDFPAEIDATSGPYPSISEKETKKTKEKKPRTIPETKLDKHPGKLLEPEENSRPASKEQSETQNPESDRIIEGLNKPTSSPPKAGEVIAEPRISKPEHSENQDNVAREEPAQNGSSGKESRIAISTMPWASFSNGERAPFEKEIKVGHSRLVQKLAVGERIGNGQPVSMIILAGENSGASMVIGSHTHVHRGSSHPKGNIEADNVEERWEHICTETPGITASINSNAQSINNSALHGSRCDARDPGVHQKLSSKKVAAASPMGQKEPLKPRKAAPRITTEQKSSHEPRIIRRCLPALSMESSESDPENPQKPRRHGCRFCCDEKKKEKADMDATSTANANAGAKPAEEVQVRRAKRRCHGLQLLQKHFYDFIKKCWLRC